MKDVMNSYRHFYLYAKGHYVKGDLITDMKILMSKRCGLEVDYIRACDITSCLAGEVMDVFLRVRHNDQLLERFITRIGRDYFTARPMDIPAGMTVEEFMDRRIIFALLIEMMLTTVTDINGELGNPSPDILPLSNVVMI